MQKKDNNKKVPNTFKAVAEAQESIKSAMRPSHRIAEELKQQLNSTEQLRKLVSSVSPMVEMMRRFEQQQVFADMLRPLENFVIPDIATATRQITNQLVSTNSAFEAFKQYRQAFDTTSMFKSIIKEQREVQKRIVESLKPSFQFSRGIALELSQANRWQDTFSSIKDSLKDFQPAVEVLKNALIIEKERFSKEYISQIAEEYIWDENSDKNVFRQDGKRLSWENIPKPVRWLIVLILATIFTIYFTAIWKEATKDTALSPERVARRIIHFRKQEVRQINKNNQNNICPPFVNTEYLRVYTAPKKRSRTIVVLTYPCEVKILKFKNKKCWALIEWKTESGEIYQGWALARYIYRKKK